MKKTIIIFAVLLIALLAYVFAFQSPQVETDTLPVVKIAYNVHSVNYSVAMVAAKKDFFKNDNFDVKMMPLKGSKEVRQAIATGHADLGFLSAARAFTGIAAGAPMKFIAPSSIASVMIFVRDDNEINTLKDLENKKVSGGSGGASDFVFRRAFKKEGLDINTIEFIDLDSDYEAIGLSEKKVIDAIPGSIYNVDKMNNFNITIMPEWLEKEYSKEQWPMVMVLANTNFIEKSPKISEQIVASIIKAQKFMNNNKEESAQIVADHINSNTLDVSAFTAEEILNTWQSGLEYTLWSDPNILVEMSKLLYDLGMIEKELVLEDIYDLRYEDILKKAQNEIYKN